MRYHLRLFPELGILLGTSCDSTTNSLFVHQPDKPNANTTRG